MKKLLLLSLIFSFGQAFAVTYTKAVNGDVFQFWRPSSPTDTPPLNLMELSDLKQLYTTGNYYSEIDPSTTKVISGTLRWFPPTTMGGVACDLGGKNYCIEEKYKSIENVKVEITFEYKEKSYYKYTSQTDKDGRFEIELKLPDARPNLNEIEPDTWSIYSRYYFAGKRYIMNPRDVWFYQDVNILKGIFDLNHRIRVTDFRVDVASKDILVDKFQENMRGPNTLKLFGELYVHSKSGDRKTITGKVHVANKFKNYQPFISISSLDTHIVDVPVDASGHFTTDIIAPEMTGLYPITIKPKFKNSHLVGYATNIYLYNNIEDSEHNRARRSESIEFNLNYDRSKTEMEELSNICYGFLSAFRKDGDEGVEGYALSLLDKKEDKVAEVSRIITLFNNYKNYNYIDNSDGYSPAKFYGDHPSFFVHILKESLFDEFMEIFWITLLDDALGDEDYIEGVPSLDLNQLYVGAQGKAISFLETVEYFKSLDPKPFFMKEAEEYLEWFSEENAKEFYFKPLSHDRISNKDRTILNATSSFYELIEKHRYKNKFKVTNNQFSAMTKLSTLTKSQKITLLNAIKEQINRIYSISISWEETNTNAYIFKFSEL